MRLFDEELERMQGRTAGENIGPYESDYEEIARVYFSFVRKID
jgi:hypothetical protein